MPDNTYTAKTRLLTPVPRSKRMRDANVTVAQQQSAQQPTAEQTWTRDTASVQGVEVLVPVAEPLVEVLRLRNGSHIVTINVDSNGYLHVDSGMYSDSFVSALGLNPDAPTPGGGGLDEDELWTILGGSSTNHHILPTYLDSVPWASVTGKPSWIGSSKPSYDWSEILNKPSWIGSSKPSYTKSEVGLGNVDNTADANKSVYGVIDYGGSNTIRIGYSGSGLTSSNLTHIAGYTDNGTKIKDVSKSVLKEWLNYTTTDIGALPLSGGAMTGSLVIATGVGISDATGNGMLVYKPTSWTGVSSSQWGVGAIDCPGVIRTSGNNLYHYKNDTQTSQLILDSGNYSSYALPLYGGTLSGNLTIQGLLNVTANGNTVTIGSQNASWCHIYNSNSVPFIFNNIVYTTNDIRPYNNSGAYNLGTSTERWNALYAMNIGLLGHIVKDGVSSGWNTGRDNSLVYVSSVNGYSPAISIKTTNGSWDIGAYNNSGFYDQLLITHVTDSQYSSSGYNSNCQIKIDKNGKVALGYGASALDISYALQVNGDIYATGAITAGASSSDKRLKKDIKQFNAMSIVDALRPIQFRWNNVAKGLDKYFDTEEVQYGLIAQECDKAMPGLAFKFKANDYYGVRYEKLIPVLLEAIKELKAEIDELKGGRL